MINLGLFSRLSHSELSVTENSWTIFQSKTTAVLALCGFILITLFAIAGLFITGHSQGAPLQPPSWQPNGTTEFLLGTDLLGRDIFIRLIQGASLTLGTSFLSVAAALLIGVGLGILGAYKRGNTMLIIMRSMDIIFAIPSLVLALLVVALLGPSLLNAGIAVMIVLLPNFVRTTVSSVEEELLKPYVEAARLDGASTYRILFKSVFPNITAPLILQITIALSIAIVDITLLGFLGMGAQSPSPEWGTMLYDARISMHIAPWGVTMPGLAILMTVLFINYIGDGLNSVIRLRKQK